MGVDRILEPEEQAEMTWMAGNGKRCHLAAVFVLCVMGAGCDLSGTARLVPVQGKVTYEGQPLATGSLVFKPDAAQSNAARLEPAATIESDGSYKLFTGGKEGAPLGKYQVSVVAQGPADDSNPYAAPKSLIPLRFAEVATSGLQVEVVESPQPGAYDVKLSK